MTSYEFHEFDSIQKHSENAEKNSISTVTKFALRQFYNSRFNQQAINAETSYCANVLCVTQFCIIPRTKCTEFCRIYIKRFVERMNFMTCIDRYTYIYLEHPVCIHNMYFDI